MKITRINGGALRWEQAPPRGGPAWYGRTGHALAYLLVGKRPGFELLIWDYSGGSAVPLGHFRTYAAATQAAEIHLIVQP